VSDLHITISRGRRDVHMMSGGRHLVRTARTTSIGTSPQGADARFSHAQGCDLVDALCATLDYWPGPQERDLDAQRSATLQLVEDLQEAADAEADANAPAALAQLALSRHVGHHLADAAYLILNAYDARADRTVVEMLSELGLMIEAMQLGTTLTNPRGRISAHMARLQELRQILPEPGPAAQARHSGPARAANRTPDSIPDDQAQVTR
jgi:hypothetical protein